MDQNINTPVYNTFLSKIMEIKKLSWGKRFLERSFGLPSCVAGYGYTECIKDLDWTLEKEVRWLFSGHFWTLLKWVAFFEAALAVSKVGLGLKSNYQLKLV